MVTATLPCIVKQQFNLREKSFWQCALNSCITGQERKHGGVMLKYFQNSYNGVKYEKHFQLS